MCDDCEENAWYAGSHFGIEKERERIIALIDQKHTPHEGDTTHNESGECTACEVIALIKGEIDQPAVSEPTNKRLGETK